MMITSLINYYFCCDNYFITSSPELFKKNIHYHKIKFIPNPVDSSIDNFKNFKNHKDMKFDMFVAISHGQNRGILKKGQFDDLETPAHKILIEDDKVEKQ